MIRSSGYFRQKAKRLKGFVRFFQGRYSGQWGTLRRRPMRKLRSELLSLHGIGPETADSILLYAAGKPIFVVDAYTRRILARHSLISSDATYDQIQKLFMDRLSRSAPLYNEYHALLVVLGKEYCRLSSPRCSECPLREIGKLRLEPGVFVKMTKSKLF